MEKLHPRLPLVMNRLLVLLLTGMVVVPLVAQAQESPLTVQQIMQDPDTWVGSSPSQPFWSEDGQTLYFRWNPQGQFPSDSLFKVAREGGEPSDTLSGVVLRPGI